MYENLPMQASCSFGLYCRQMIYDAVEVGSMSIYYGAYSVSRRLINVMIYDSGNAQVGYTPMYDEARVGYFDIP